VNGSIKAVDCVGDSQQSKTPGDPVVVPAAEPLGKSLEHIIRRAARAKYGQYNDGDDIETKVKDSSKKLESVKELSKRQI